MNVLIVTGEKSAENYASLLIDELKRKGNFSFFSICSDILSKKTIKIADYRDISIIGAKEALSVLKKAFNIMRKAKKTIINNNIKLIILMDFPEFNLKIARFGAKHNIKVVYYITPKVWAWRKGRIKQLNRYTDLIMPILPFERVFYNSKNISKAKYCGHPIVDIITPHIGKHKKEKIILIMPGSRKSEIMFNYKPMFEAAKMIRETHPYFRFVWIYPKHLPIQMAETLRNGFDFIEIEHNPYEFMDKSYFGILKSGTTTLEAALFGLPMVVVYRLSKISYYIGKMLIKNIKFVSLPNLIAGEEIVKELIEDEAEANSIYREFLRVHSDTNIRRQMINRLKSIGKILGEYPITPKIADEIAKIL